jgi:hypothetical protein
LINRGASVGGSATCRVIHRTPLAPRFPLMRSMSESHTFHGDVLPPMRKAFSRPSSIIRRTVIGDTPSALPITEASALSVVGRGHVRPSACSAAPISTRAATYWRPLRISGASFKQSVTITAKLLNSMTIRVSLFILLENLIVCVRLFGFCRNESLAEALRRSSARPRRLGAQKVAARARGQAPSFGGVEGMTKRKSIS